MVNGSQEKRSWVRQYSQQRCARSATSRRSSAEICSDILGEAYAQMIHQGGQANASQSGEFDERRHSLGVQQFRSIAKRGQFIVIRVAYGTIFALSLKQGTASAQFLRHSLIDPSKQLRFC